MTRKPLSYIYNSEKKNNKSKNYKSPKIIISIISCCFQGTERTAETFVGKPGDFAIFQVHESRQGRPGQPRVQHGLFGLRIAKVAWRFGSHGDHVQRDQQIGAGQERQKTVGYFGGRGGGETVKSHRGRVRGIDTKVSARAEIEGRRGTSNKLIMCVAFRKSQSESTKSVRNW